MSRPAQAVTERPDLLLRALIPQMLPGTPRLSCAITLHAPAASDSGITVCSDAFASAVETLTWRLREGPAAEALRTGVPVHVPSIDECTGRWPSFVLAVREHGLGGAHSEPLQHRGRRFGAVSWYSRGAVAIYAVSPVHFAAYALAAASTIAMLVPLEDSNDDGLLL